ncbi:type VI secretion system contractile sheath large subunit [Photorhabdus sp. RM96S]|uniref:type VI secretion system contractile sheath large subunit n=1 Tax=Photorhabdus sp. RM96S TaxID=3342822 RepID=UPI0036D86ECC
MTGQEQAAAAATTPCAEGSVYQSLFEKIHLQPVEQLSDIEFFQHSDALADVTADERVTAAVRVFLNLLNASAQKVERLDKTLLDHHIGELDSQISRQLDEVMHHPEFQRIESAWRGLKFLVDRTDFRQNVRIEVLDVTKEDLRQDFDDAPEIIQSGFYHHTYLQEYDTPGGEPVGAVIADYEFDAGPQDIALLRNIASVSAAAHMPFIGAVGPAFFGKKTMEDVAAIKDLGSYFDRAEYIKWQAFRDSDDARYIGLTMPRVLGRLPYIFLLSRIAHYLKLIQRENIGTTKDRRLLEIELNNWINTLVTEMTDPADDVQASYPLREARVTVEDIDDNPGFFRVRLYAVPHFQVEGLDVNLSLVAQMPKAKG